MKTKVVLLVALLLATVAYAAGRKSTMDIAEVDLDGGVVLFRIQTEDEKKVAAVFVRDPHLIDTVYMQASAAQLRAIAKAAEETAVELEK